jgi:predicted phage terminase large subunit-like protein
MSALESKASLIASLNKKNVRAWTKRFTDKQLIALDKDWWFWARPEQLEPPGDWAVWLVLAGRGFGKTRTGTEWVRNNICGKTPLAAGKARRIAIVAETAADARDVLVEGDSGLLAIHTDDFRPNYEPSKRRVTWPNGAIATLYNATEPDQLRGPQHDLALCDELAKWRYARETWDQLQFGLRLGKHPRQCITTTPRPIPVLREILASPLTHTTRGSTFDNRANLADSFFDQIIARYEGTRLGRQELQAEILDEAEGALWSRQTLEECRISEDPAEFKRLVVSIDPAVTSGEEADEHGIIIAGLGADNIGYILDDISCRGTPGDVVRRAAQAYHDWQADAVIAEVNNGGEWIGHTVKQTDSRVNYRAVRASRGKHTRAEPVAALYEQHRIKHVGAFAALEDQLCQWEPHGNMPSPDRMDAMVWAITDLMLERKTFRRRRLGI